MLGSEMQLKGVKMLVMAISAVAMVLVTWAVAQWGCIRLEPDIKWMGTEAQRIDIVNARHAPACYRLLIMSSYSSNTWAS